VKLVIDANILVSAYTVEGAVRERWRSGLGLHELIISPEIFSEVERTLREAQFGLSGANIRAILLDILDRCVLVRARSKYEGSVGDEKDRHLANLAREVGADSILTGDQALLEMQTIAGVRVMSLSEFVQGCS